MSKADSRVVVVVVGGEERQGKRQNFGHPYQSLVFQQCGYDTVT